MKRASPIVAAALRELITDFESGRLLCGAGYVENHTTEARLDAIVELIDRTTPATSAAAQWHLDYRPFEAIQNKYFPDTAQAELDDGEY